MNFKTRKSNKILKEKIIKLLFLSLAVAIFMVIKEPDAGFNMLPYTFFILLNHNSNRGGESNFIMTFDFLFALSIAYFMYKIFYKK